MSYILDANTFIEAKNRYYRMNICPGYWNWLLLKCGTQDVRSIDKIAHELSKGSDDLSVWADAHPELFHKTTDAGTQGHFAAVANHVANLPNMKPGAIPSFLSGADPWLIASAMQTGATVVTHEVYAPDIRRKVQIPNVCIHFNVPYIDTFDLLDTLQAEFVLAA